MAAWKPLGLSMNTKCPPCIFCYENNFDYRWIDIDGWIKRHDGDINLWDPNNFTRDFHMLASFLCTLIVHPIFEAIYKSCWHFPLWGTVKKEKICFMLTSSYKLNKV